MAGIVVGVDGSKDADTALLWALREGALRSATVTAVVACGPDDCPESLSGESGKSARLEAAAHLVVQDALARLGTPVLGGVLGAVELVEQAVAADPVEALVRTSEWADMLVVGHRGAGRLRRLLAGSVSSACLHQASSPVVVVRDGALPAASEQRDVLVGVDGSEPSIVALRWGATAAKVRSTSLRVLHSWSPVPPVYTGFYIGAGGGFDAEIIEKVAANVLNESLRLAFGDDGPDVPTESVLAVGSAARSLVDASRNAQLLVVGARGGGGFTELLLGSASHQCVHHAHCPVAVLRGADDVQPSHPAPPGPPGPPAPRTGEAA
jgi:nucleotide-binding universal stress UspA family protein